MIAHLRSSTHTPVNHPNNAVSLLSIETLFKYNDQELNYRNTTGNSRRLRNGHVMIEA
jgi:hypothetical protein